MHDVFNGTAHEGKLSAQFMTKMSLFYIAIYMKNMQYAFQESVKEAFKRNGKGWWVILVSFKQNKTFTLPSPITHLKKSVNNESGRIWLTVKRDAIKHNQKTVFVLQLLKF